MKITIIYHERDFLQLEMVAASDRYAGATCLFVAPDGLSSFASRIERFPASPDDERFYEFGSRKPGFAGGYANLRFHCVNRAGHAQVEVELIDDVSQVESAASASFAFRIEAAGLDRFTPQLRKLERMRSGEAFLPAYIA